MPSPANGADNDGDEMHTKGIDNDPEDPSNQSSEKSIIDACTAVDANSMIEELCELLSRVFEERKVQIIPMVNPASLQQIRGKYSRSFTPYSLGIA